MHTFRRLPFAPVALLVVALSAPSPAADPTEEGRPITFTDLMRLRTIHGTVLADGGGWAAWEERPDRGDGEVVVRSLDGAAEHRIERGAEPSLTPDGRWAAAFVRPTLTERERARREELEGDDAPRDGLALLDTADGTVTTAERVEAFAFSPDGRWLAWRHVPDPEPEPDPCAGDPAGAETPAEAEEVEGMPETAPPSPAPGEPAPTGPRTSVEPEGEDGDTDDDEVPRGARLVLLELATGERTAVDDVLEWSFDRGSRWLALTTAGTDRTAAAVVLPLGDAIEPQPVVVREGGRFTAPTWAPERPLLALVAATLDEDDGEPGPAAVLLWDEDDGQTREAVPATAPPQGWSIPSDNELTWSADGERLFLGLRPLDDEPEESGSTDEETPDPLDPEAIVADRTVDVWHVDDPRIVPNQRAEWEEESERRWSAVYHLASDRLVPLATEEIRVVEPVDNRRAALGWADVPYLKERTWDGWYGDAHVVDLVTGEATMVAARLDRRPSLSPTGRHVAFWRSPDWYLFDASTGEQRCLTAGLDAPFADPRHDYPSPAEGFEVAGWIADGSAVLIHDRWDLWRFPVGGGEPVRLTAGAEERLVHRVIDLDPDDEEEAPGSAERFEPGQRLLLSTSDDDDKSWGFAEVAVDRPGARTLLHEPAKLTYVTRADEAPVLLYTDESYTRFGDLWVADLGLDGRRRLSDANPELARHDWGEARLVEWLSADGDPLDGVLITPAGWSEGDPPVPVLVYFYRLFSDRLHEFNEPVVNHRPSFPVYASDGYAIFLPDVRFEVGRPGLSALKSLVPGVLHLVEKGIADPDAVGLHGHSWSGYQTAHLVTLTDLFAAAVAGAPVSNMTSAYSGIRWGSGLARQFQYERSQSRIGASPWEDLPAYLENSPVFSADEIETPLLISFGDEDEAVPWTQGIELYLALRRLGKPAAMLVYRGEPHHLQQYANKLDYSIRMKEFFDHFLKGEPAPEWWTQGVPYSGE